MDNIQLILSEKRRILGCEAIFPADYFEIPGLQGFEDLKAVDDYAIQKLQQFKGQTVDVYVNSGLTIESFAVLTAASNLRIRLRMFHYDNLQDNYVPQEVEWGEWPVEAKLSKEKFALCEKRHLGLPEQSIFEMIPKERLFDYAWQKEQAKLVLQRHAPCQADIYLTGLTALGISALNAAYCLKIPVTVYHYNHDTEDYFPQAINKMRMNSRINL